MPDPNPIQPSGSSWLRRLRQLAVAAVLLITLAALFYAEENFRGKHAWERYRKDAEARGIKLDFASHIPQPIPDAENGANTPFVQSWFPKPRPDGTNYWPTKYGEASSKITINRRTKGSGGQDDRFITDLTAWQQAFALLKEPKDKKAKKVERAGHDTNLDPQEQARAAAAVLEELKVYEPALAELRAMSVYPKVRYPITYKLDEPFSILLPHLAKVKGIVQTLSLQACAELAAGQTNQAFQTVKLMLWFCDSIEDESFLISQLVRLAARQIITQPVWEGIARHQWSEDQLKELQERLLQTDFASALDRCIGGERAGAITAIQWMRKQNKLGETMAMFASEDGTGMAAGNTGAANVAGWFIPNGWFYFEMANLGRLMDDQVRGGWEAESKLFHPRVVDANNQRLNEQFGRGTLDSVAHHYLFAKLFLPALKKASMRFSRGQTTAYQAGLACAIERYHLTHGKYPDALADLVPEYLSKIPHEVVSAEPMRYHQTAEGYVLYSAGWDGKDDDGEFLRAAKDGQPERGDWVWRSAP